MSFDAFIESAWDDHADQADAVAVRLGQSLAVVETPAQIPAYARLVTHVFGEHLGEWQRGVALLDALRKAAAGDDSAGTAAIARGIATLRYGGGDAQVLAGLTIEDRIIVLATASAALVGQRRFLPAIEAYTQAMQLAPGAPAGSPAPRALAVGGNNLASALEGKPDRDAAETAGMVAAAECALQYWKLAGTWLEEERAEYRLTRSLLQARDASRAAVSAGRCIRICTENVAPPFELFFAHAVQAIALRAAGDHAASADARLHALAQYALAAPGEQAWCKSDLDELGV
ncbi:MAG: hypothetical protein ABI537_07815 [Casimicrobiaceae bacterium]